jgi:hypothetical protein
MEEFKVNTLIINDTYPVFGELSISRDLTMDDQGKLSISTSGAVSMHDYFEEINSIESDRYIVKGVEVIHEGFGSNDLRIAYTFKASELIINGGRRLIDGPELIDAEKERWEKSNGRRAGTDGE